MGNQNSKTRLKKDPATGIVLKQCTKCDQWKPNTTKYYPWAKKKNGPLRANCKVCQAKARKTYRKSWDPVQRRIYLRARGRALVTLANTYPDLYKHLLESELAKDPEWEKMAGGGGKSKI